MYSTYASIAPRAMPSAGVETLYGNTLQSGRR